MFLGNANTYDLDINIRAIKLISYDIKLWNFFLTYTLSDALVTKVLPHWSHLWSSVDRPRWVTSVLMIVSLLLLLSLLTKILVIFSSPFFFSIFTVSATEVSLLSSDSIVSHSRLMGCDNSGFVDVGGTGCVVYSLFLLVMMLSLLAGNNRANALLVFWKGGSLPRCNVPVSGAIWLEDANGAGDR